MQYPNFIIETDFDASIHAEILDSIIRSDRNLLFIAIDRAIYEMMTGMGQLYDVDYIFSQSGANRNQLVLMYCIDIVLYHLHSIHNQRGVPQVRKDRYDRAIEWMKAASESTYGLPGLELNSEIASKTYKNNQLLFGSNDKRSNHF